MFLCMRTILIVLSLNIILCQNQSSQKQSKVNFQKEISKKQKCKCLNNGECLSSQSNLQGSSIEKQFYCRCPKFYIGQICQSQADQFKLSEQISSKINAFQYKYFYFEPSQQNAYSFSIQFCLENLISTKGISQKKEEQLTFFLVRQKQDGTFAINEQITNPFTSSVDQKSCVQIVIDYTVLLITKIKKVQKIIFGIKYGQRLIEKSKDQQEQVRTSLSQEQTKIKARSQPSQKKQSQNKTITQSNTIQFKVNIKKKSIKIQAKKQQEKGKKQNVKNINDVTSKSPSKLQQDKDQTNSRLMYITFAVYPFAVEYIIFYILFSFTSFVSFIIIGIMIFVIRNKILGIQITRQFLAKNRFVNDIKHFEQYLPEQKYIKKEKKEGDKSPNSSQNQCAICLIKFENMHTIRRTHCDHVFHKFCIDSWCEQNLTCPMCRKSLTRKNLSQFYNSTVLELKQSPQSDD